MAGPSQRRSLATRLTAQGFSFPFDISPFLDRAIKMSVRGGDPAALAYSLILQSKAFKKHYPGIFRPNGTLKMTPAEYEAYVDSARSAASSAGLSINRRQVGRAIANNTSADEFAFKIDAAKQIRANQQVINAFNAELKAQGKAPLKTADQIFDFFANRGTAETYRVYERSAIRGAAEASGQSISRGEARRLSNLTAGTTTVDEAVERFQQIEQDLEFAREELRAFGVDEQRLRTGAFSDNARGQQARALREKALRQREAALQTDQVQRGLELSEQNRPILRGPQQEAGA